MFKRGTFPYGKRNEGQLECSLVPVHPVLLPSLPEIPNPTASERVTAGGRPIARSFLSHLWVGC